MPGLYIHVPFCRRKCPYCDFYSETASREVRQRFLEALAVELRQIPSGFSPDTVFIGGGTPTVFDPDHFERLLRTIVDRGHVVEWTCEANPGTLTADHIRLMRTFGVNRVSLGVQSFQPRLLSLLGRIHTAEEAVEAFAMLREAGFDNIGLDLMFGMPGMTLDDLDRDLDRALALQPEHVACYDLIYEPGTSLTEQRDRGLIRPLDDEQEEKLYRRMRYRLMEAGFHHYEISNFARPRRECRHNLLYWSGGDYIGCGPSAHSHWDGVRYANVRSLTAYYEAMETGRSPVDFREKLEPEAKARETLVMSLRRLDGVDRDAFRRTTGFDIRALAGSTLERLIEEGLLEETGQTVRLTEQGLFVSNAVFAELV